MTAIQENVKDQGTVNDDEGKIKFNFFGSFAIFS